MLCARSIKPFVRRRWGLRWTRSTAMEIHLNSLFVVRMQPIDFVVLSKIAEKLESQLETVPIRQDVLSIARAASAAPAATCKRANAVVAINPRNWATTRKQLRNGVIGMWLHRRAASALSSSVPRNPNLTTIEPNRHGPPTSTARSP